MKRLCNSVNEGFVNEGFLNLTEAIDLQLAQGTRNQIVDKLIEKADEFFPNTFVADGKDKTSDNDENGGYDRLLALRSWLDEWCRDDPLQLKLAVGAKLIEEIRAYIEKKTHFQCSAGIGLSKTIAKLVCARHKPRKQTIIPPQYVQNVYETTKIDSVRNLGGKLGNALMETFGIRTMADLGLIPQEELRERFPENATWLINLINGDDGDSVRARVQPKSIAVAKNFLGRSELTTVTEVRKWVTGLSSELARRLAEDQAKHQRTANNLVVGFVTSLREHQHRTYPLMSTNPETLRATLWEFMRSYNRDRGGKLWEPPVIHINLSAGKFQEGVSAASKQITAWLDKSKNLFDQAPPDRASELIEANDEDEIMVLKVVNPRPEIDNESLLPNTSHQQPNIDTTTFHANRKRRGIALYFPERIDEIPTECLNGLPDDIRIELEEYYGKRKRHRTRVTDIENAEPQAAPKTTTNSKTRRITKKAIKKRLPQKPIRKNNVQKITNYFPLLTTGESSLY